MTIFTHWKRGNRKGVTQKGERMSREQREGGGLYYTRSRREGGRIVREYVGSGPLAELMALADENDRQRRQEEARAWKREREGLEREDETAGALCELAELLNRAALVAAGYRLHNRGEWRKPRERD
jgi:hypothetical protein